MGCFQLHKLRVCVRVCVCGIIDMRELEESAAVILGVLCFLLEVLDQLTFSAANWIFDYQS